ncbi:ABC transporter ATP-binding protein/permease [Aliifodinibius sp. S!AR15-10]|uniref:ABC transporter ATP-binding protein n=1 Tax=Aliifodinibius sp. S!AR15-10 TaxID=2950437 RepID=UPI0028599E40|nr:ABC transporter ATP-binding protein [Aliifodinibius sp. S!AR15-10]MDR8392088.1 ABC transporter ATP-binding protein/permease [Aliifodinibius sp. S!AR15-10]
MNKETSQTRASRKSLWAALKRIFRLSKPYRTKFYVATVLALFASGVGLSVPLGLKALLDAVFQTGDNALLNLITVILMGLFILQAFLSFGSNYWLEWVGERVVTDLRKQLYEHLHRLGFRFFSNKRLGEITSRLTNDVASIRSALTNAVPSSITTTFSLLGSVALMVYLNWRLSLIVFVTVPFVTIMTRYFGNKIRVLARGVQDDLANSTAIAEDALGAIRIVKAFAREPYEVDRYADSVENLFQTSRKKIVLSSLFWSTVGGMFMAALVIIFWYGGKEVLAGRLSPGDLVAFIFYAFAIARSISQMSRLYTTINSAVGASDRIFELLDERPEVQDQGHARPLPQVKGTVSFRNVTFAYEGDRAVLQDITFEAKTGQMVAVVGPSGAGKTTLVNLIPRFFDPQEGQILIDGIDIKTVQKKSLREQIAIVPQDVHLFGTSIRENIRYGNLDASDGEIERAARDANAWEYIEDLPEGLDAMIGEKGVKLSGGQRQRLAIARALLKNPRILLLDEATSSLDSESEAQVQEALERLMHNRTTFIIAHRLSTVRNADRILVLDAGRIIQDGKHEDLIMEDGLYKHLYELQFRERADETF